MTYTYGDRSGIWYKPGHFEKAGIEPPKTWDEFLASFDKLKAAGYATPVAIGAKYWSHTEWFESLLLRTAGVETAAKLAAHEIPWTDPAVKTALKKYAEMLQAGCCGDPAAMFATDWDGAADQVFKADASNYQLIGMWVNARARNDYGLTEGVDYSLFQFPALGMGNDDTSSVDTKELNVTANGTNPAAADAFLDFITSAEAANLMAGYGFASPSSEADNSLLGPVQQVATSAVGELEGAVRPRRSSARRPGRRVSRPAPEVPAGSLRRQYRCGDRRDRGQGRRSVLMTRSRPSIKPWRRLRRAPWRRSRAMTGESWSSRAGGVFAMRRPPGCSSLPVLILFGIAVVFPLIDTIRLSFFDIKGLAQPKYVGFGNYLKLFADPAFRQTLSTTLIFTLGTTVIAVGVGWVIAMLCSFAPRQTLPFRVMIFSAFGVSEAVTGYMWITHAPPRRRRPAQLRSSACSASRTSPSPGSAIRARRSGR